jgi:hypothetical protein
MTGPLSGVTIVITQGGVTVQTLTTDANGNANCVLNSGTYTATLTYSGRTPVVFTLTVSQNNTYIIFALPNISGTGNAPLGQVTITQTGDLPLSTPVVKVTTTHPGFTNT